MSYRWEDLPNGFNIADYDVVILNFAVFGDVDYATSFDLSNLPPAVDFVRLMFSPDAEIVAIGDPGVYIGGNPYQSVGYWLPVWFKTIEHSVGEAFEVVDDRFSSYFEHLKAWAFFTSKEVTAKEAFPPFDIEEFDPDGEGLVGQLEPIAETRFGQPIACAIKLVTYKTVSRRYRQYEFGRVSQRAYWLPEPTEIGVGEAIDLLLRDRYGVNKNTTAPAWAEMYELPAESPIRERLAEAKRRLKAMAEEIESLEGALLRAGRFRQLLFETGQDVLEPVVRDALRVLGASVEDPASRGKEDGRLTDPFGRRAMLEIKGRSGPLKLSDVRQLDQWVRDGMAEDWDSKGVLVANLLSNESPEARARVFPDNCVRTAERFGLALVTTTQIFKAVTSHQSGTLDNEVFWETLMTCEGVCPLPEL